MAPDDAGRAVRPVALVTGASSGIGRAIAEELSAGSRIAAHDLVVVARSKDALDELASDLARRDGTSVEVLSADLEADDGLAAVRERIEAGDRPVELVVNNAAYGSSGRFAEIPLGSAEGQLACNVAALVRLSHAAVKAMSARGGGRICNVGSLASFSPTPGMAVYGATKAFVLSFSQALRMEAAASGVQVTCLCPGFTATGFQRRAQVDQSNIRRFMWQDPPAVARACVAGIAANRAVIIPGWHNKLAIALTRFTPPAIVRRSANLMSGRFRPSETGGNRHPRSRSLPSGPASARRS